MKKHNFVLVPKEKIILGGPMNVFIRCKRKGCVAGIDWASLENPEILLERTKKNTPKNCPYLPKFV